MNKKVFNQGKKKERGGRRRGKGEKESS